MKTDGLDCVVILNLDGQRYGLPLATVERVLPMAAVSPLPQAPAIALGVINHGIVKDHQGVLHFETAPGAGTQFHLDLAADNGWTVDANKDMDSR